MIVKAVASMIATLSAGAVEAPATPLALAPAGPWTVNGDADGACMLTRHGMAYMTLRSGGLSGVGTYLSFKVPGSDKRLTRFTVDRSAFDTLPATDSLTLGSDTSVTIAIRNGKGAMAALDACQTKLLQAWGIDPASFGPGKPAPTPRSSPTNWFGPNDYPSAALLANMTGRVVMVLTVGEDGRVKACRAVASAGRMLDEATCALATRRARFTPAKDAAGKALASWMVLPVRWSLP